MSLETPPSSRDDFEIAIITALPRENNAVLCSLDENWHGLRHRYARATGDDNSYDFGRCGRHAVVVVTLPRMGKVEASSAARSLKMSFPFLKLALLVGVCGAVPKKRDGTEILLGDVIISDVVLELDYGRLYQNGLVRRDTIQDTPGRPDEEILGLLQRWKTPTLMRQLREEMEHNLKALLEHRDITAVYPTASQDKLFPSEYIHKHRHLACLECNISDAAGSVCDAAMQASCRELGCNENQLVRRSRLSQFHGVGDTPDHQIHIGSIGTADSVMRSSIHRDKVAELEGVIAFEMEAAGVWDKFNCVIIKGVCDYADSHKDKNWQDYAAAVAASVAKAVLGQYVSHERSSQPDPSHGLSQRTPLSAVTSRTASDLESFHSVDMSVPTEIFQRAVRGFKQHLDDDTIESFHATDLHALKRELRRIQTEQEQANALRNLRRMELFLTKMERLGTTLHSIIGANEIMGCIWGPVKSIIRIAKNNTNQQLDAALSAYERLGDALPSFNDPSGVLRYHMGLQRVLARVIADVMEFHQNAMRLYSGRALKVIFQPQWKAFHETFDHIVHRINSHRALLEDKMRAATIYSPQVHQDIPEIRIYLQNLEKEILNLRQREIEKEETKFHAVKAWLADAGTEVNHKTICRDREHYPNSGDWIIGDRKVKEWLCPDSDRPSRSILWINGRPGTGKTYLASILVEHCRADTDSITCYFYCNQGLGIDTTAITVIRGVLLQLVCQHRELVSYCHAVLEKSLSPTLLDLSTAYSMLDTFCERVPRLYVILDGLDECGEGRKDLLDKFKRLALHPRGYAPAKFRVAILSQPVSEIKNALAEAEVLALSPEHNREDIQKYCLHRKRELYKFEFAEQHLKQVIDTICIKADGMFLFAKLVMNNLSRQPTRKLFYDEIHGSRLPTELHGAYKRIMDRLERDLEEEQLKYTRLLLGWLVCAKRPLKWKEIQLALSIDTRSSVVDEDLRVRDDVQELCGSLVQVLKGNRVELVHKTAEIFIAQQSDINLAAAECDLALRCLRYLTLVFFTRTISDGNLRDHALQGEFAFQDYAVASWFLHVRSLVDGKEAFVEGTVMSGGLQPSTQVSRITRDLTEFVTFYKESFTSWGNIDQSHAECGFFQQYPFYQNLAKIWDHICVAQRGSIDERNDVSINSLKTALTRNRTLLEQLSREPGLDFSSLYDDRPYRCPKVLCPYFHEGFSDEKARGDHVSRHNLPHRCPVEGCERSSLGFSQKNALNHHIKRYHPEECDLRESFTQPGKKRAQNTRWECSTCHQFFVRKNKLEDHERTIHRGERPFRCSECGKAFGRHSDMRRHEKNHERRRQLAG